MVSGRIKKAMATTLVLASTIGITSCYRTNNNKGIQDANQETQTDLRNRLADMERKLNAVEANQEHYIESSIDRAERQERKPARGLVKRTHAKPVSKLEQLLRNEKQADERKLNQMNGQINALSQKMQDQKNAIEIMRQWQIQQQQLYAQQQYARQQQQYQEQQNAQRQYAQQQQQYQEQQNAQQQYQQQYQEQPPVVVQPYVFSYPFGYAMPFGYGYGYIGPGYGGFGMWGRRFGGFGGGRGFGRR